MKPRDLFFLGVGIFIGALGQSIKDNPAPAKKLVRALKVYIRDGWPWKDFWPPLSFVSEQPQGTRRTYPPPHPGGPNTNDVYDWAVDWIKQTGRDGSLKSRKEAWEAVKIHFPDFVSTVLPEMEKKQRDSFHRAVKDRLKKRS